MTYPLHIEDYEEFTDAWYEHEAVGTSDTDKGLEAHDATGRTVARMPSGNSDDYNLWVYLNLK